MSDSARLPDSTNGDEDQTAHVAVSAVRLDDEVRAGSTVSRYVVLDEIGRGAMGRVLRGYDPKLQREVALKVVHHGAGDAESSERMVREARAMAKLSHPNVVAVYDAEVSDLGVVLVMEYVAGQTLREWTKAASRSWPETIETFLCAGRGLAAAHAQELLHRDFKPANVLVADSGAVKVTDFGLAKSAGGSSADGPRSTGSMASPGETLTRAGSVLGTPRYMAPEQHQGLAVGPAADQYAFCVAVWEALAAEAPFRGAKLASLKHKGPPPWPGNTSVPSRIADALRRGLAVDPGERWGSMDALLEALQYDPRGRRKRWLLGAGALGVLGIGGVAVQSQANSRAQRCAGASEHLVGVWDDARRTEVQTAILGTRVAYAQGVWARTSESFDGYATQWATMHTEACEATTVRGEQSSEVMDLRMACLHRAKLGFAASTDVLGHADAAVVRRAHRIVHELDPLSRCADIEALGAGVEPPLPEDEEAVEAIREHLAVAKAERAAGRYEEALSAVEHAETRLEGVRYEPVATEAAVERGNLLDDLGDYDAAALELDRALELAARNRQWETMGVAAARLLYVVGYRQGKPDLGLRYRELAQGSILAGTRAEVGFRDSLGAVLAAKGNYEESAAQHRAALALLEKTVGRDHRSLATAHNNIGIALKDQGKYEEAESELRIALALSTRALGPDHPDVAESHNNLAIALKAQGKYEEAESEYRVALAVLQRALGAEHPYISTARNNLAIALHLRGRSEEAEAELRAALALRERALGAEHPSVAASRNNLGNVLQEQGKNEEAETEHRAALALRKKALGPDHPHVAQSHNNLANALLAQGRHEEAEAELRTAVALREKILRPDHPEAATTRMILAKLLLEAGETEEALEVADAAWAVLRSEATPAERRAEIGFVLARASWARGRSPSVPRPHREELQARARSLARRAARDYAQAGDRFDKNLADVRAWLGRVDAAPRH